MNKLALLVCGVAVACVPGELEGGRYACDPGLTGFDQCGDGWRCGREAVCHREGDTSQRWLCLSSADCEGAWVCGLNAAGTARECHDPASPERFTCANDTDCVSSWVCGLAASRTARECHDPAAPEEFACVTHSDCVGGFRCGLADSRQAGECHDPAHPEAWACKSDDDCLSGWRCSSESACVDPRLDALFGTSELDAGEPVLVNPVARQPFDAVSVSQPITVTSGSAVRLITAQRGDTFEALVLDSLTASYTSYSVEEPGVRTFIAQGALSDTFDRDIGRYVLEEQPRFYASLLDGGISAYTLLRDGGTQVERVRFGATPTYLVGVQHFKASTGNDGVPGMLGFEDDPSIWYSIIYGPEDWDHVPLWVDNPAYVDFADVPGNHMRDMGSVYTDGGWACVYAADERGLWVAQLDGRNDNSWDFDPIDSPQLPNAACGNAPMKIDNLQTLGDSWLAYQTHTDAGEGQLTVLDTSAMVLHAGDLHCTSQNGLPCTAADRLPVRVDLGPCTACLGSTLLDYALVNARPVPELDVRCGQSDGGGVNTFYRLSHRPGSTTCERRLQLGQSSLFTHSGVRTMEQPSPGSTAWSGAEGELWVGPNVSEASSITFDRAANGVVLKGSGPRDVVAFTDELMGLPEAAYGLISTRIDGLFAPVAGAPHWVLRNTSLTDLTGVSTFTEGRTLALVATSTFEGPYAAALTRSQTNARVAVVTARGQLFSADLERVLSGLDAFTVEALRLSLVNPITSLALPEVAQTASPHWVDGYLVTGGRVHTLTAETPTRWRSEELPLPSNRVPLEVWFDRDRARVGFDDGTVSSLPSRVPLAPAVPGGAVDFAQTCGQQLVLGSSGLFRLRVTEGAAVGTWEPLPLPPGFAALGFEAGRVHGVGPDVYVFTRDGDTARVTLGRCGALP